MSAVERWYYAVLDAVQTPTHRLNGLSAVGLSVVIVAICWRVVRWSLGLAVRLLAWVPRAAHVVAVTIVGVARVAWRVTVWLVVAVSWLVRLLAIIILVVANKVIPPMARLTVGVGLGILYVTLATALGAPGGLKITDKR